jgi:hypothetical protein
MQVTFDLDIYFQYEFKVSTIDSMSNFQNQIDTVLQKNKITIK